MKYTKEQRLDIGRRIYDGEMTKYQVAEQYEISDQTARDYMRLYRHENDLPPKYGHHAANGSMTVPKTLPETQNLEAICLLSKLGAAKHHIDVTVDMDELDLTSAESKATYDEIQKWVQDNFGFHVTNLNIAQVKQKHGIIERENYNKPKSPDSKQPGCPEEKVNAIEEALRYFRMIEGGDF